MYYRKLTRKKRTLMGSTQVWLGDDHVLMVRSTHFQEEYRRFQLSDIQALVAVETAPRLAMQVLLLTGVALAFFGMFGADGIFGRTFFALLGVTLLGIAAYDIVRGQRCRCRLLTEVSSETIDPVTRTSDFRRLLTSLEPTLEAVQGVLPIDERQLSGLTMREAFVKPEDRGPEGASKYLRHTLFGVLLANAAFLVVFYYWKYEEGFALSISILMGEFVLAGLLLLRSKRFGVDGAVKTLIVAAAVLLALDFFSGVGQAGYLIYSIAEAGRTKTTAPKFWDLPWFMILGKVSIGWRAFVGLIGFVLLWMSRDRIEEVPPSQP